MLNTESSLQILFDYNRKSRIGLPEAVFCQGKHFSIIRRLFLEFSSEKKSPILFTRLQPDVFNALDSELQKLVNYDEISKTAYTGTLNRLNNKISHRIAIVSAGSADASVAWEAARTLEYLDISFQMFEDSGVAGLWRLMSRLEEINTCSAIIVIAGLDAALASVLGGLTPLPIFAVPTSIGYGQAAGGQTALHSMLASCAPGVSVFNIDNGYGAACAAARVLNLLDNF